MYYDARPSTSIEGNSQSVSGNKGVVKKEMIALCNFCGAPANTDKGIIFVRANIIFNKLNKWINAPICEACYKR